MCSDQYIMYGYIVISICMYTSMDIVGIQLILCCINSVDSTCPP